MKSVFNNRQCAHIWAQQTQERGRSNNGNMFFEGRTIYSYGHHFPMGHFIDSETVLVNSDSYSMSTGKQQGYVRFAVNHKRRLYVSTNVLEAFIWDNSFNANAQAIAVRECENTVQYYLQRATAKKAAKYKANDVQAAQNAVTECRALFQEFNADYLPELKALADIVFTDDINKAIALEKERLEKETAERLAKEKAKQEIITFEMRNFWIRGQSMPSYHPGASNKIYMRIEGDIIETSKGASFPVDHAKRAFIFIRNWKENHTGENWSRATNRTIHLGHFVVDTIDTQGNVKAGCHYVEWDEIERIARELNIYP